MEVKTETCRERQREKRALIGNRKSNEESRSKMRQEIECKLLNFKSVELNFISTRRH